MVTGTEAEAKRVETIMQRCGVEEFGIYNAPNAPARTQQPVATPPNLLVQKLQIITTSSFTKNVW